MSESSALTPREIVHELDAFIIGQDAAKRAVAIALRNRWRRKQLSADLREEVAPKNIILIGPTGVGKTEIARRMARLVRSPFVKVEASKFTEVGYVGRDVEGMIRDLVEAALDMVKQEQREAAHEEAAKAAEEKLLDLLLPASEDEEGEAAERRERLRDRFREKLRANELEDREVEVSYESGGAGPSVSVLGGLPGGPPAEGGKGGLDLKSLFQQLGGKKQVTRTVPVSEAREILTAQEAELKIDHEKAQGEALARAEREGIVFLDEIDKIAVAQERGGAGEVSRQGVQRDLLPLVEGTTVQTRYGPVKTDHVLFVAAGAFHLAKPSDLIPELQGRFPIRVELDALGEEEFRRILSEPRASLTKQYAALLAADGIQLEWTADGIAAIASLARQVNEATANIGARRLHTMLEKLLEDELFDAPDRQETVVVDATFVQSRLASLAGDEDLSRYIL